MMIDRELMELAAKAAGIQYRLYPVTGNIYILKDGESTGKTWSPLTDDGDALRLAVELGMRIEIDLECEDVCTYIYPQDGEKVSACENFGISKDRFAATRRAIVRAAAEIGRNHE